MVRPNRTSPEAKTSLADSRPSANTAVEWPARPAEILRRASMPLTSIPAVATRCPVDILVWGARSLCPGRVDLLGVDAQLGEGRLGLTGVELAVARQPRQRRGHNRFGVDLGRILDGEVKCTIESRLIHHRFIQRPGLESLAVNPISDQPHRYIPSPDQNPRSHR